VLTLTNIQSANVSFYAVAVSNSFCGLISSNVLLTIAGYADPTWNGLVAYYPFDGNANDQTGNGNNGTNNGAILTTDRFGNPNSAYQFDGSSSFIDFGSPSDLAFTSNFTVTAWCNFSGGSQNPRVVCFGSDSGYELLTAGTGTTRNFQFVCGGVTINTTLNCNQDTWYSICAVVQAGTGFIYINGSLAGAGSADSPSYPTDLEIGTKSENGTDFWGGSIDDVRIYNRALSANEVAYLYSLESQSTLRPPQTLSGTLGVGPNLNLTLTGFPGGNYVLETATNLLPPIQWVPMLTNAADSNGVWQFTDTNLSNAQLFYRVTTP
jgi:hypothetical protein